MHQDLYRCLSQSDVRCRFQETLEFEVYLAKRQERCRMRRFETGTSVCLLQNHLANVMFIFILSTGRLVSKKPANGPFLAHQRWKEEEAERKAREARGEKPIRKINPKKQWTPSRIVKWLLILVAGTMALGNFLVKSPLWGFEDQMVKTYRSLVTVSPGFLPVGKVRLRLILAMITSPKRCSLPHSWLLSMVGTLRSPYTWVSTATYTMSRLQEEFMVPLGHTMSC
jgi:hypothetical protein